MLRAVRIQNFRCLRDVTVELEPFTVIVGPNASGKTALADALSLRAPPTRADFYRYREEPVLSDSHGVRWPFPTPHPLGLSARATKYTLDPNHLRQERTADEAYVLDERGGNLANLFDTLAREDQERFVHQFVELVPVYADLKARARDGKKRLQFRDRWDERVWYEPEQVSDGSLFAAALVALTFQRDTPATIVLEDPDHGLHPYLQRQVVELLRKLSRGEIGATPVQVVCTTHSRAFLDHLEPEEVRFLSRDRETGETRIQSAPTDNPKWREVYARYSESLGDLWMTGALGGVPAT